MSQVKQLLNTLLWDIYGKQTQHGRDYSCRSLVTKNFTNMPASRFLLEPSARRLENLSILHLTDVCAILKVEIRMMGYVLERVLIVRDRLMRHQDILCGFVDAILHLEFHEAHPRMRFSLSPPVPKAIYNKSPSPTKMQPRINNNVSDLVFPYGLKNDEELTAPATLTKVATDEGDANSDYNEWLHAMKLVARLPGGMPPEFRRKLWLSLADKYLKSKNIDWAKEEEKCFCEKWREDDEELGIQIVKDLHRTGSNLCTGPAGSINQAKLKRILLGYARYNPEVGYCQGFNMLGALILQVMDKNESESMKVMIYLVEGVLPKGYFYGSMGGLQADMGVFRELMQTRLPRLAKHLQKLQGPIENAYEPPLTNVFTMQWFLTMFCTCLPMSCVLRVWDLVLIEGSDVLLRTALVLWSLLEGRILSSRSADDFYGRMGSFSSELLNGHLIDSNGLIEKVVQLGPIPDIQKLRDKHLYNIAPLRHKQGLQFYLDDEETESDEDSRLAVATMWGIPWGRRGSQGQATTTIITSNQTPSNKQSIENKDRIALDISLLKKQYDRLRERQKQAHIILTTACSSARQGVTATANNANQTVSVNQLLQGRTAIVTHKGKRVGPPSGAIPPARKPSLPAVLQTKPIEKQLRRGETLHWRDTDFSKSRRDSLTWKEIKADRATLLSDSSTTTHSGPPRKLRTRLGKSDSSSYSEESDGEDGSSTDTSLCDEDDASTGDKTLSSSLENSPRRRTKSGHKTREPSKLHRLKETQEVIKERKRPKSWAHSSNEIPFTLMTSDFTALSGDESITETQPTLHVPHQKDDEDSTTECDRMSTFKYSNEMGLGDTNYSPIAGDLATTKLGPLHVETHALSAPALIAITSTSQLSPMPDLSTYLSNSVISPLPTPKPRLLDSTNSLGSGDGDDRKTFDVNEEGVTNQYFERVNSVERPTKLDLFYSLNEEDSIRSAYQETKLTHEKEIQSEIAKNNFILKIDKALEAESDQKFLELVVESEVPAQDASHKRRMELLMDYSEKSSAAFISEATSEASTALNKEKKAEKIEERDNNIPGKSCAHFAVEQNLEKSVVPHLDKKQAMINSNSSKKRRDPRRLTLTRSTTIEIEERFQDLERRMSNENFFRNNDERIIENNANTEKSKRIPSTADLEERYNALEQKLTTKEMGTKLAQNAEILQDVDGAPNVNEKDTLNGNVAVDAESPQQTKPKPKRDSIPSTEDLEHRFNSLSASSSLNKDSLDLTDKTNSKDKQTEKELQDSKNLNEEPLDDQETQAETKSRTGETPKAKGSENEKPRLTKLPSTAELEDRFHRLEQQLSVQKSSPTAHKKEPPDDAAEHKESHSSNEETKHQKLQKAIPAEAESAESVDTSSAKKKTPPSTEELEKRFDALEKRLSTVNIEDEVIEKAEKSESHEDEASKSNSIPDSGKEKEREKSPVVKKQLKSMHSFNEKCKLINEDLAREEEKLQAEKAEKLAEELEKRKEEQRVTKRRLSEPPSTEDLEKRYETLKRRMSSKTVVSKMLSKSETVEEAMQRIERVVSEEECEMIEKSEPIEADATDQPAPTRAKEPPTSEELERRYEKLQQKETKKDEKHSRKMSQEEPSKQKVVSQQNLQEAHKTADKKAQAENLKLEEKLQQKPGLKEKVDDLQKDAQQQKRSSNDKIEGSKHQTAETAMKKEMPSQESMEKRSPKEKPETPRKNKAVSHEENGISAKVETKSKLEKKEKESSIPEKADTTQSPQIPEPPPPMPITEVLKKDPKYHQRRALVEELQSKMQTQPNDENLKPSRINPNRKTPPIPAEIRKPRYDETLEAHANTAFYRSENYEPWQTLQSKKMVRRFSDLPSRADLENRLQFLEKQLAKKFYKQRCASDSEVASRKYFVKIPPKNMSDDVPGTSQKDSNDAAIERRVLALEKQLSENSLKLLEAMRSRKEELSVESPRGLCAEAEHIDGAGKELVRYAHFEELSESEKDKPINISINIKMMLNKDTTLAKEKVDSLPTTEELEKRLEALEEQLKISRALDITQTIKEEPNALKGDESEVAEQEVTSKENIQAKACIGQVDAQNQKTNLTESPKNEKTKIKDEIANQDSRKKEIDTHVAEMPKQMIEEQSTNESEKKSTSTDERKAPEEKTSNLKSETNSASNEDIETHKEKTCNQERANPLEMKSTLKDDKETPKEMTSQSKNANETKSTSNDVKKPSEEKTNNLKSKEDSIDKVISNETAADGQQNVVIDTSEVGQVDPNNKTMVLLLNNEPKAVKVRRLTRANTEELEGLFQALEKQLNERNLVKSEDGTLRHVDSEKPTAESKAISDLTKEIADFTSSDQAEAKSKPEPTAEPRENPKSKEKHQEKPEEEYDWGPDPVKKHLKRKTVYLPSTKELEARFRSLERQIKLLEDVEKIDVEQRLNEIERKIKLQYSLSHEKDLSKFLELCEGKGLDDDATLIATEVTAAPAKQTCECGGNTRASPGSSKPKSPGTSPGRKSPARTNSQTSPKADKSTYTSPRSPYTSPSRKAHEVTACIPSTEDLEYRYRALDLKRSKSRESLKDKAAQQKQPIHPLEMLLDPSPDDSHIPTTGELEHRIRVLDEKRVSPSPPRYSSSRSPERRQRQNYTPRDSYVTSPLKPEPPTAEQLDARMRALEEDKCFDYRMQKNFKEFNEKLKNAVSPSLSFEEFKSLKSREASPKRSDSARASTPKSALRDAEAESRLAELRNRSTSPKVIRFEDELSRPKSRTELRDAERMVGNDFGVLQTIQENSKTLHRILKKTLADSSSSISGSASEGLDAFGSRLMRETSPITRTGTHTGVPLRTDDNINDRLSSIKNTIKSIETLCEEKPYRKEKCQRYIDSLFSDSVHFANPHKKTSSEDLSRTESRYRDYTPSIRISDHSQRPSERYLGRSMGSAESIRSTSPLRAASPLQYRSNRDLRRETSPRRRRDEEYEENESRVRRDLIKPNYYFDNHRDLSGSSSLTKFHKVDSQLDTYKFDERERSSSRSASRSPLRSPYGSREMTMLHNTYNNYNTNTMNTSTLSANSSKRLDFDRPVSPYRPTSHNLLGFDTLKRTNTPVYNPGKLEIRHTTVTSTFYDRLLTERQLEKSLSRPPSKSPILSPSPTAKSYTDIAAASIHLKSPTMGERSILGANASAASGVAAKYAPTPSYGTGNLNTTSSPATILPYTTSYKSILTETTTTTSNTTQYSATTPTGNSSTYESALHARLLPLATDASALSTDLRIRSCENILMHLKSSSTAAGTGPAATLATTPVALNCTPTFSTSNMNHSASPLGSSTYASTAANIATTTTTTNSYTSLYLPSSGTTSYSATLPSGPSNATSALTSYSADVYKPLLPLALPQPANTGTSYGVYTSSFSDTSFTAKTDTELPKY